MLNVLTFQFSAGLLLTLILGLAMLMWQEWRLAFLFGGSALLFTLITATYRAPQTVEYMLPAYVSLALIIGTPLGGVLGGRELPTGYRALAYLRYALTALVIVIALSLGFERFASYSRLSSSYASRDYANEILDEAPRDSLLLANWHWATPLWYLQDVEGRRPDIEVRYVFPEGEAYALTWARRVAEGLAEWPGCHHYQF